MTEELKQKAYEYAIIEIPFIECITQNDLERLVQQAYIAGATENSIQWHDLREDPTDLPKDTSVKRVYVGDNKYHQLYYSNGKWVYSDKGGLHFIGNAIAWCEEPQFKE